MISILKYWEYKQTVTWVGTQIVEIDITIELHVTLHGISRIATIKDTTLDTYNIEIVSYIWGAFLQNLHQNNLSIAASGLKTWPH